MSGDRTWGCWLAATLGAFAVLEARALRTRTVDKPSGTLTATLRRWLGLNPRRGRRFVLGPLFAGFLAYLATHFLLGWFNT